MRSCGTCMPWSVKVVANRARTLMLSAVNPNRFWLSSCAGVSLIHVTVVSAIRSIGRCFTVRTPRTLAGTAFPGSSGPAISTLLMS